jgi:hypothetical protein
MAKKSFKRTNKRRVNRSKKMSTRRIRRKTCRRKTKRKPRRSNKKRYTRKMRGGMDGLGTDDLVQRVGRGHIIFPGVPHQQNLFREWPTFSTTEYLNDDPNRSPNLLSILPLRAQGTVPFSLSVDSEGFVVITSLRDNKMLAEGTNFALTTFVPSDIYLDGAWANAHLAQTTAEKLLTSSYPAILHFSGKHLGDEKSAIVIYETHDALVAADTDFKEKLLRQAKTIESIKEAKPPQPVKIREYKLVKVNPLKNEVWRPGHAEHFYLAVDDDKLYLSDHLGKEVPNEKFLGVIPEDLSVAGREHIFIREYLESGNPGAEVDSSSSGLVDARPYHYIYITAKDGYLHKFKVAHNDLDLERLRAIQKHISKLISVQKPADGTAEEVKDT